MKAEQIWKISTGKGMTVAVLDSGVDAENPDLKGQVLDGKDLAPDEAGNEHHDFKGHGTGMAGLIAGSGRSGGGDGAFGLAPGSKILPIRLRIEARDLYPEAIRSAVDAGAKVINASFGGAKPPEKEEIDAVNYALRKGALIFAGVGNRGNKGNEVIYPAGIPGVVGVGAIGEDLKRTAESQHGPQVDLVAPGENMVAPCAGKTGICKSHGTSDATAIASATAALIWSKHPDWTNNQVLRVMLNTAGGPTSGNKRNDHIGYGAVRPLVALKNPGDPGPADEYPLPDLRAAEANSAAPEASKPAAGGEEGRESERPETASEEGDNTTLWLALGLGAAALIGCAVAVPLVRRRRNS